MSRPGRPGWVTLPQGRRWWTGSEYKLEPPGAGGGALGGLQRLAGQALGLARNEIEYLGKQVRDKAVVPAIDQGLSSGVLPPRAGMYARFLTGTSKPLNALPPSLKPAVAEAVGKARERQRFTAPAMTAQQSIDREKARLLAEWTPEMRQNLGETALQMEATKRARLATPVAPQQPLPATDGQGRIDVQYEDQATTPVLHETLGRFHVRDERILDRYDFDEPHWQPRGIGTRESMTPTRVLQDIGWNAARGLGLIRPNSGYEINAPYR